MRIFIYISAISFLLFISCSQPKQKLETEVSSFIEAQVSLFLEVQNSIDKYNLDALLSETFIKKINGIKMVSNLNEYKANSLIFLKGFPDMNYTYSARLIKGYEAFITWVFTGTHTGLFGDLNATGKKVKFGGISHLYFNKNGKIYREDVFYNELDLLQQLGFSLNPPITE